MHDAIEGFIRYEPNFDRITPNPDADYPNRITVSFYRNDGTPDIGYALSGIGITGATSIYMPAPDVWQQACEFIAPDTLIVYQVKAKQPTATSRFDTCTKYVYVYQYDYGNLSRFSKEIYSIRSGSTKQQRAGNWSIIRSFSDIKSTVLSFVVETPAYSTENSITQHTVIPMSVSPSLMLNTMDVVAKRYLYGEFKAKGIHFGDLAMKAVERLNLNHVNMLEFLSDLRHPTKLIPKLKNLSKLKTAAGNYLNYQYGIMPTISDLKEIYRALMKVKPHMDLYGYKTSSSSQITSKTVEDICYTLEQHIKIAVRDEDSYMVQIVNRIESIGIFPTFSNVWDLIPYSFVIDWFIDVGDLLERIDTRLKLMRFEIPYVTMSTKESRSVNLSPSHISPYTGTVTRKVYHRWVTDRCPVPPLILSTEPTVSNHWLESGALLISRAK